MDKNETFEYSYSTEEQEELRSIREKYTAKKEISTDREEMLKRLRFLDRSVTKRGTSVSLIVGIIGVLLLGLGMCCTMEWGGELFIPGIVIGVVGMLVLAAAYPLYNYITKKQREKIAPEIIRLTDELMK